MEEFMLNNLWGVIGKLLVFACLVFPAASAAEIFSAWIFSTGIIKDSYMFRPWTKLANSRMNHNNRCVPVCILMYFYMLFL